MMGQKETIMKAFSLPYQDTRGMKRKISQENELTCKHRSFMERRDRHTEISTPCHKNDPLVAKILQVVAADSVAREKQVQLCDRTYLLENGTSKQSQAWGTLGYDPSCHKDIKNRSAERQEPPQFQTRVQW